MTSETAVPTAVGHSTVNRPNMVSVGTIVWLSSELMFFAGLFAMYFTIRAVSPALWGEETPLLDLPFASINTTILVLSSVTCQLGVFAAERFQPYRTGSLLNVRRWGMVEWYVLTFLMGSTFIGGQVWEYATLVSEGLTIASSPYGSVFYLTTGFHGLHVIGGLIAFCVVIARAFASYRFGHHEATSAIVTSYYWHFVDVVWVGLFAVIYLIQ
ncbi:cytochrome c oxidase subunit 3 [Pseudokineococcus lusitanus]|uniref:cytochrome-c oxidase n=1 Tax=Pseudokineococcus lusitanus TaxID=763993 RepID=A0A3N1HT82_9ACTN|nr:heme-copper oxidase subunit III [Pseudokineococcus lusitanus]ROP45711.1 cytochrome c oxidase subunit 3 [Pseudokineococcus lusitanus]